MGTINTKAQGHAVHARTGKDGAFYSANGTLLAYVESFTVQTSFNNAQYAVLGNALELETLNTHGHTLTFSEILIYESLYMQQLMKFLSGASTGMNPTFIGSVLGNNGSEERIVYKNCIPSGQIDLQNVTPGEVIKRNWSFHINSEPVLQKKLSI